MEAPATSDGLVVYVHEADRGSAILLRITLPRVVSHQALRLSVGGALRRSPDSFLLVLAQDGELGTGKLRLVLHPTSVAPLQVPPRRKITLSAPRSASFGGTSITLAGAPDRRRRSLPCSWNGLTPSPPLLVRPMRSHASSLAPRILSGPVAPLPLGLPKPLSMEGLGVLPRPDTPTSARRTSPDRRAEEEVTPEGLVLRKGEVVGATSDGLLSMILGAHAPSGEVLDETLLTYRYWAAPSAFLALLAARFDAFASASGELRGVLRLRVLSMLRRWVEVGFTDFEQDETLLNRLLDLIDHALKITHGTQLAKWSEKLKMFVHEQVNNRLTLRFPTHHLPLLLADHHLAAHAGAVTGTALTDWLCTHLRVSRQKAVIVGNQFTPRFFLPAAASKERFFRDSRDALYLVQRATAGAASGREEEGEGGEGRPKVASKHRSVDECSLMKVHPVELARQLTLVEHELFRAIEAPELLFANWKRDARHQLAPHVVAVIDHFNRTLAWATTEILSPPTPKLRRAAVVRLVQVGLECRRLSNWNGVMEIVSSLQSAPVQRLKHTWRGLGAKEMGQFHELVDAMDFVHHLKRYRDDLERVDPPALPYMGLFLQDLLMIEEIPTRSKHDPGLINVAKLRKVAGTIRRLQRLQGVAYQLKAQAAVQAWLAQAPVLSDADIEHTSRSAEPL